MNNRFKRSTFLSPLKILFGSVCAVFTLALIAAAFALSNAQASTQGNTQSPDNIWQFVEESTITASGERQIVPQIYQTARVNEEGLKQLLGTAPLEFSQEAKDTEVSLALPMPDGAFAMFRIEESPIMEPSLAALYPEITTYRGQGINDPTATVRFDLTPAGFHAMILSERGTVYIDPYSQGDTANYLTYFKADYRNEGKPFQCFFEDDDSAPIGLSGPFAPNISNGTILRTYRLALAATGEYTATKGGTVAAALAAMTTTMNRVNGVYERDLATRMVLVANNTSIIYTNSVTDPYTNNDGFVMLGQNQANLDLVIGTASYDIGHVFSTGGGGVAFLGVLCSGSNKGRGVTGLPNPTGDPFDIDYVAHEMGHQFGGRHTFNGTVSNCSGGNRSASAAYEPGSGSTIMAYAGICGSQNLQANSDDYFHVKSLEEIRSVIAATSCDVETATGNTLPTVTVGLTVTIPKSTPFTLTADGSDANGDAITYCWEEYDLGPASPPDTDVDGNARPIFRTFDPTTNPSRTFPKMSNVLNNTTSFGEALPTINRTMNFQVTVRDNRSGGGGINTATKQVIVSAGAGPFLVTQPNTSVTWTGGTQQTVTWSVANTSSAPVSAANVKISLSSDGGNTFPTVLAASTPNDGTENITVPNAATTLARIKVEALNNVFFDVSNANFIIAFNPTAVGLVGFTATAQDGRVLLKWHTGFEVDNLGFNIYRDQDGIRTRITSQLIAGSALSDGPGTTLLSGHSYYWADTPPAGKSVRYWLEDIDLNGKSTLNGPYSITAAPKSGAAGAQKRSELVSQIGFRRALLENGLGSAPVTRAGSLAPGSAATLQLQSGVASQPGLKFAIKQEGFYRVTQSELVRAGLDPEVDPRLLRLFVDGIEQPIKVPGEQDGRLDAGDAVEFYGVGLEAASTDTRVYWLVAAETRGARMPVTQGKGGRIASGGFTFTVERKDRTIYFPALRNGDAENFFGAVVASQPVDQSLWLQHLDRTAQARAAVEVSLQGVTQAAHDVRVQLNGTDVTRVNFTGQSQGKMLVSISHSLLREGENTVRLVAEGGPSDVSLVDTISIRYSHSYTADGNALRLTALAGQRVSISGFTRRDIRLVDVTDVNGAQEIAATVTEGKNGYTVSGAVAGSGTRALLAFADSQASRPAAVTPNQPSSLGEPGNGADLLIITQREFLSTLGSLKSLREGQGMSVAVVDIEDIYDEFSFGNKSPQAVKEFCFYAATSWMKKPRFVLLAGDASYDARQYLGLGDFDAVPTKLIDTNFMETASDDWFADFDNDGVPELGVGRLPFRNADEASTMIAKIIGYERSSPSEEVLLVADTNDGFDFEQASAQLEPLLPANLRVNQINRGQMDAATAKTRLIEAINRGQKIVNYAGHGSQNQWRDNLLVDEDGSRMTNMDHLSVFVMMTCLTGYFDDPARHSLAESLLKAERGGAVAVWASSGLTLPGDQALMNRGLYKSLFSATARPRLGDAIRNAKSAIGDVDIRRTWILLGDPTMRLR